MAAIPAPPSSQIINPGFEDGSTGWTFAASGGASSPAISLIDPQSGTYCVRHAGTGETQDGSASSNQVYPINPGQSINAAGWIRVGAGTDGTSGSVYLTFVDAAGATVGSPVYGANIAYGPSHNTTWRRSTVSASPPTGAVGVKFGFSFNTSASGTESVIFGDDAWWDYLYPSTASLTSPSIGATFLTTDVIPLRINNSPGTGATLVATRYYLATYDSGTSTWGSASLVATVSGGDGAYNLAAQPAGLHRVYAQVEFSNNSYITTNTHEFTVGAFTPDSREFRASNSYTYMVGENFTGLGAGLPPTAIVTGAEILVDYSLELLVRALDAGATDPNLANADVIFDITEGGVLEAALLEKSGTSYTALGNTMSVDVPIDRADFTVDEVGTSEGMKWVTYNSTAASAIVGGETALFGVNQVDASNFMARAIGLRFYPRLNAKPAYAERGDAAIRIKINSMKLRVYFDAGSVEYYFASPDKTNVIKGSLAAYNVETGSFATGDAAGTMQLNPDLEVVLGSGGVIQDDWTIHSAYPPTDANQIGVVDEAMFYNGLPGYEAVENNRSRYVFITANFYGDKNLNAIYGANGVGRAFSYNPNFFYKIWTQADSTKDKPRHVAFHHTHLALGFDDGRVDLSVVGEPFNFDGADGASSWATGDPVVGLLPLTGTMLGIFGSKSITGLSGTTVDNFATQILSPNIGAVEYTVTDMGFPVYANAYGIYTLEQTSSYGDYLGNPLSQSVSPWLRPRLIRKATSNKEVVVAWPVRAKNQYKLAFADGYVLTMTMNYGGQTAPTFSKQKYFHANTNHAPLLFSASDDLYIQPAIVPAAISSQLDDGGEERIHVAPKMDAPAPTPYYSSGSGGSGGGPVYTGDVVRVFISGSVNRITRASFPNGEPGGFDFGSTFDRAINLYIPGGPYYFEYDSELDEYRGEGALNPGDVWYNQIMRWGTEGDPDAYFAYMTVLT